MFDGRGDATAVTLYETFVDRLRLRLLQSFCAIEIDDRQARGQLPVRTSEAVSRQRRHTGLIDEMCKDKEKELMEIA